MKQLLLIPVAALLVIGCGLVRKKEELRRFIPGMYTRFSEHQFGREYDTLVISLQNAYANEYKIVRRWRYEREVEGRKLEPEYKIQVSAAILEPTRSLLREMKTGRIYTADVNSGSLFSGAIKYRKL
ncbi:MAG: hypothetical protein ACTHK8_08380 [Ginsengibacter sp.]